jgi:thiol-disulfide isomerase/thioredoxin
LSLSAGEIEFRDLTFAEGLAAAKEENKPVFIDCYTTWCGPCKWMSANIFTEESVANYYNENYICLKIDMEKGEGVDIAKKHSIRAYPTLLYLTGEGEKLLVSVGANREPQSYIDNGERAKDPNNNIPFYLANKDNNFEDPEFMSAYFKLMSEANMLNTDDVDRYFSALDFNEWLTDINWNILTSAPLAMDNSTFQKLLRNSEKIEEQRGKKALKFINDRIYQSLGQELYRAATDEEKEAYKTLKSDFAASEYIARDEVVFKLSMLEYQKIKDWEQWSETALNGVPKFYWDDASALNNVAWAAYENVKDNGLLTSALKWAKRAIELNEAHHIVDTYAHLLAATGNNDAALEQETRALELATAAGAATEAYENYIEELKD